MVRPDASRWDSGQKDNSKNRIWNYAEVMWAWRKWLATIPVGGLAFFLMSVIGDCILFNAIPSSKGEFRFRDTRQDSVHSEWVPFHRKKGDEWKQHIISHSITDSEDGKLGEYEIITATVFLQSVGHTKRTPMGPVDSRFVSFVLQKEGEPDIYFSIQKISAELDVHKKDWKHGGGVYVQISDGRDDSLRPMKDGHKDRRNLDLGTLRWRSIKESKVTVERFLRYYTQTSAHLSPSYNYYSRNTQDHVTATLQILNQLQIFDKGGGVVGETKEVRGMLSILNDLVTGRLGHMVFGEYDTNGH